MTDNPADSELNGKKSPRQELREKRRKIAEDLAFGEITVQEGDDQLDHLIDEYVATMPRPKKSHLQKNGDVSFCGWGTESGVEFVEIIEDATCQSCIRLARHRAGIGEK